MSSPTMRFLSNCKPVRVAHVDIRDIVASLCDELQSCVDEFLEPFVNLPASQPHRDSIGQIEFPRAARIEAQRREPQPCLDEPPLSRQIALRDDRLLAIRSGKLRELGRDVMLIL
jgi:hypothetical protein